MRWVMLAILFSGQGEAFLPMRVEPGRPAWEPSAAIGEVTLRLDPGLPEAVEIIWLVRAPGPTGWKVADVVPVRPPGREVVLRGPAARDTLLLARAPGADGYLLDGPFRWPTSRAVRDLRPEWRRTVRGAGLASSGAEISWMPAPGAETPDGWPACRWHGPDSWECVGVPLALPGAVVAGSAGALSAGLATGVVSGGVENVPVVNSAWGRLVVSRHVDRRPVRAGEVTAAVRRLEVPRPRGRSLRVTAILDERIAVHPVAPGVFWVRGNEVPEESWIEVAGDGGAAVRIAVPDAAAGAATLPLEIELEPGYPLEGRVVTDAPLPAPGAAVVLWRLLPADADNPRAPRRRLYLGETVSGENGRFRFGALAADEHEIVALHPEFGRGEVRVPAGVPEVDVRLRRPSVVTGMIVKDDGPAAGVSVSVVPDLLQAAASDDLTELVGGQAVTGTDGRFRLAVPPRGSSEVRIGHGSTVKRHPLGPADTLPPVIDLGTLRLADAILLTLVLEPSDGCDVQVSGPVGRSGLTIVRARRLGPAMFEAQVPEPGPWLVSATCGSAERRVSPAVIEVTRDSTLPLAWR